MEIDLDPGFNGVEGQGHRSKVKVKYKKNVFLSLLSDRSSEVKVTKVKVKFKCQGHR